MWQWHLRGGLGRAWFLVFYVGLVAVPLALGRLIDDPEATFAGNLGSGLGIAAFAMLLAGFWLTGRFQVIAARAGLDLILTFHRYAAIGAVGLLVAHVVTVRAVGSDGPSPAAWVAFGVVLLIVAMASGRSRAGLNFEVWRFSHGIGAMIVALAGLVHITTDGTYSSEPALTVFWVAMVAVAIGSLLWVHAVRPWRKIRHPYEVVAVDKAANRTWTVALEPRNGEAIDFIAGQYAFVSFGGHGFRKPGNPFSFSSAPSQRSRIEFTIKENGDLTSKISELEIGSVAYIDGPLGRLSPGNYRGPKREIEGAVFIAGGVGITPIISILKEAKHRNQPQPMRLLCGARSSDDLAFTQEIAELEEALDLRVHYVVADPPEGWDGDTGRLDGSFLAKHLDDTTKGHMFFVCGSTRMIDSVLDDLDELQLATPGLVHSENFSVYD